MRVCSSIYYEVLSLLFRHTMFNFADLNSARELLATFGAGRNLIRHVRRADTDDQYIQHTPEGITPEAKMWKDACWNENLETWLTRPKLMVVCYQQYGTLSLHS